MWFAFARFVRTMESVRMLLASRIREMTREREKKGGDGETRREKKGGAKRREATETGEYSGRKEE